MIKSMAEFMKLLSIYILFFMIGLGPAAISQNYFQKTFGGVGNDVAVDFEQTIDNCIFLLGYTNSFGNGGYDIVLTKINLDGSIIWSKLYGAAGDDYAHDIKRVTNGDYIICGNTTSSGFGENDIYILRIDLNGNLI